MKTTFTETTYNKFQLATKDNSNYIEYCKDEYHKNLTKRLYCYVSK